MQYALMPLDLTHWAFKGKKFVDNLNMQNMSSNTFLLVFLK